MTGRTKKRSKRTEESSLYDNSKQLGDMMWEDAMRMADALAPDVPSDSEPLDEFDQFNILMLAAAEFSPGYWDDPEALTDLYKLKKKFMGVEDKQLQELARVAKVARSGIPDPRITPQNPEWEKVTGHG